MDQKLIPTLHCLEHSVAFRCLWALEELKATNGTVYHLKTYPRHRGQAPDELKKVFPLGKSPILTLEWANQQDEPLPVFQIKPGVLTENQLILRFLGEEYGNGLWETETKADERRDTFFQAFSTMSLMPKIDIIVLLESLILVLPFGISGLLRLILGPVLSIFKSGLPPMFQILEDALTAEKPWFAGSKFGIADFTVSFGIDTAAQRGYLDAREFPKLTDWHSRIKARGGYIQALEKGGGYNLKTYGHGQ